MQVAVFEADNIAFDKRFDSSSVEMEVAVPTKSNPDLFRCRVTMRRIAGSGFDRNPSNGQAGGRGVLREQELAGRYPRVRKLPDLSSAYPFHLRRVSYRLSGGKFQRVFATSSDTDGYPWVIPALGSWRTVVDRVVNASAFSYKKADGTTATTPVDVKTVDITLVVTTATSPTRQYTYKTSVTLRGES